jgi:hypothetical protein
MFVRKKTTKYGTVKHYLVEGYRENGKVRQRVAAYLGDAATVEDAIAEASKRLAYHQGRLTKYRAHMEAALQKWREQMEEWERKYPRRGKKKKKFHGEPPQRDHRGWRWNPNNPARVYWSYKPAVLRCERRVADLTNQLEKLESVPRSAQVTHSEA